MNVVAASGAEPFLARFEGLRARLPGDGEMRAQAARLLRGSGLPGVRDEAWRYTSLRSLAGLGFREPLIAAEGCEALVARLPALDAPRLVFVDGRYREDLSSVLPDSVRAHRFAHTPDFGTLARPEREKLVALNTMLAEDGALLSVAEGVDGGTVLIASLASDVHGTPVDFHPRHAIHLAPGARLVVVEVALGEGTYLHNPVTEVTVAEGATLTHVRLQDEGARAFHFSTLYADVAARGTYDGFVLNLGGRVARAEIHARLLGEGGVVHLNGAQLLRGQQHGDVTTVVRHEAPGCASRQTVKNVLADRARGVFQGRIEVARVAQKTDGYQMSQSLLLSPEAETDTKPELEIFADDVKCSHGATVGELDAAQLFYLRSRGVPEAEARAMLVRAFLAEALDPITHAGARAMLEQAVEGWWRGQAA